MPVVGLQSAFSAFAAEPSMHDASGSHFATDHRFSFLPTNDSSGSGSGGHSSAMFDDNNTIFSSFLSPSSSSWGSTSCTSSSSSSSSYSSTASSASTALSSAAAAAAAAASASRLRLGCGHSARSGLAAAATTPANFAPVASASSFLTTRAASYATSAANTTSASSFLVAQPASSSSLAGQHRGLYRPSLPSSFDADPDEDTGTDALEAELNSEVQMVEDEATKAMGPRPKGEYAETGDPGFQPTPGGPQQPPRKPSKDPRVDGFGNVATPFGTDLFLEDNGKPEPPEQTDRIMEVPKGPNMDCTRPFLRFARESQWLKDTDIFCPYWIRPMGTSGKEGSMPGVAPWFHPKFTFKTPVHAVRVRMGRQGTEEPDWDVTYSGPPGAVDQVLNTAIPTGGKKLPFQYFAEPITDYARWWLRLTEADKNHAPRFDELLTLKVNPVLKVESEPNVPRPFIHIPKDSQDGAIRVYDDYEVNDSLDPETGTPKRAFL